MDTVTHPPTDSPKAPKAEDIVAWIQAHPQFFADHPELLASLEWPTDNLVKEGATSLADFQARRLRQEVGKLQDQLKNLTQIAADNEKLMHRLHQMTLTLMSKTELNDFLSALFATLKEEFGADAICLHLHQLPNPTEDTQDIVALKPDTLAWLLDASSDAKPQCGRFTQTKLQALFPQLEPTPISIQSAAAVPLDQVGLLAIGANDQTKFQPHMGTLFLELLAATIAHRLAPTSHSR